MQEPRRLGRPRPPRSTAQSSYDEVDERLVRRPEGQEETLLPAEAGSKRGAAVLGLIAAACAFGAGVTFFLGPEKGEEYFAGYLLEQSLSIDNLFVFVLLFDAFKVPRGTRDQDSECVAKVLQWGIASAAVLRLAMILLGAELIEVFQPVLLGFAGLLLASSYKILAAPKDREEEDISNNAVVKFCRRFIAVSRDYDGARFFTVEDGARKATPLLLVLATIELSDIVFAVDSVPAVFGVTKDPFIVWTSNMFAIVSLRGLFAFVSTALRDLKYLEKAVAVVLGWIGLKLIVEYFGWHVSTTVSLGVVLLTLGAGVGASLWLKGPGDEGAQAQLPPAERDRGADRDKEAKGR